MPNDELSDADFALLERVDGVYSDELKYDGFTELMRLYKAFVPAPVDDDSYRRGPVLPAGACITRVYHLMHRAP